MASSLHITVFAIIFILGPALVVIRWLQPYRNGKIHEDNIVCFFWFAVIYVVAGVFGFYFLEDIKNANGRPSSGAFFAAIALFYVTLFIGVHVSSIWDVCFNWVNQQIRKRININKEKS